MYNHYTKFWFLLCLFLLFSFNFSHLNAKDQIPKIEGTISQEKLSYYNDSFDSHRTDLWDFAQLTYNPKQISKFKRADFKFNNGKLLIETKKGFFSKAGFESRFTLSGDFDIQIDCSTEFLNKSVGMDQRVLFSVSERGKLAEYSIVAWIQLLKKKGDSRGYMTASCNYPIGNWETGNRTTIDTFDGTLRLIRKRGKIIMSYRLKNKHEWVKMASLDFTKKDMKIVFFVNNFIWGRKDIDANSGFKAAFDNFKINAAHAIIESEI